MYLSCSDGLKYKKIDNSMDRNLRRKKEIVEAVETFIILRGLMRIKSSKRDNVPEHAIIAGNLQTFLPDGVYETCKCKHLQSISSLFAFWLRLCSCESSVNLTISGRSLRCKIACCDHIFTVLITLKFVD